MSGRWADDDIAGEPNFSREGWSHLYIYRNFPDVQAVIYAHPFHVMPFAAQCIPMEPVLEATQKFGLIEPTQSAPAHTRDLAEHVLAAMQGKEDKMRKQAAVVMIPYHGIICAGKEFYMTLDAVERVNTNAYCLLARQNFAGLRDDAGMILTINANAAVDVVMFIDRFHSGETMRPASGHERRRKGTGCGGGAQGVRCASTGGLLCGWQER